MVIFICDPCGKLMVPLDLYMHWDTQNSDYILQTPHDIGTGLHGALQLFWSICAKQRAVRAISTGVCTAQVSHTTVCALRIRCRQSLRSLTFVE